MYVVLYCIIVRRFDLLLEKRLIDVNVNNNNDNNNNNNNNKVGINMI